MKVILSILSAGIMLALTGCVVVTPVKRELPLLEKNTVFHSDDPSKVKLLIFNASNPVWSGPNSGKDIWIDGKGVTRLETGQYVELPISKGIHTVKLLHQDVFDFYSSHEIVIDDSSNILEICTAGTTNKARLVNKLPDKFRESFFSIYDPSPSYLGLRDLPFFEDGLRIERVERKGFFCAW